MEDLFGGNGEDNGAAFSECKKYRYALWRIWSRELPLVMFIGLNPSTANQSEDDPTIRRVKRFAKDWGYGGVYMMNCFPFVSTDPKMLYDCSNTVINDGWLEEISKRCYKVVFAWGNFDVVKKLGVDYILSNKFPNAVALQINKNGSPKHPLYVAANVVPVKFK